MLIAFFLSTVILGWLFYASYNIASGVYLKSLCYNKDAGNAIAITFDDGVDPVMTPKVLDVLNRYDAKATFFIVGEKAVRHPEIVRRIVADGHGIGNHSYFHKWNFPLKSTSKIFNEIEMCKLALQKTVGFDTILFRPPFGVTNPMVGRAARKAGVVSIGWSIRSLDTMGHSIAQVRERVARQVKSGQVILLHDNRAGADILLEGILIDINKKGLRTATINELFKID